ncbi:MAG: holdfast anchoring protein HfaB [Parvibaculum sp.]|nr:holdfast anchoring protein HfaB [Parvibaculum sp.]
MFNIAKAVLAHKALPTKTLGMLSVAFALTGCISASAGSDGRYTMPTGNAPVINNETPYSSALRCVATRIHNDSQTLRIAVGNIKDYTGKEEADGSGRKLTQGAALMAMSALGKAGVPLVERYDTAITELELKYTNNKLIGDGAQMNADGSSEGTSDYRKIFAGEIRGSDYYLVGGITELNFNIRSGGVDGAVSSPDAMGWGVSAGGKIYVMNIGLDLRLVNSRTLEVVDFVSYQKQIVGHEVSAGVFDFLGGNLFQIGAGESAQEPLQLAVRAVLERAVLKMLVPLYHVNPSDCGSKIAGSKSDPMGTIDYRQSNPSGAASPSTPSRSAYVAPAAQQQTYAQPYSQVAPQAAAPAPAYQAAPVKAADTSPYGYYSEVDNSGLRGNVN